MTMRIEKDSIGVIEIPDEAYYGVQSIRAQQNFPLSHQTMLPEMIESLAEIKKAAAMANPAFSVLISGKYNARDQSSFCFKNAMGRSIWFQHSKNCNTMALIMPA